jgi:biopolymer transport protein ExbD
MAGGSGEQDLNLVPYMDIMVNLIMFMLIVTAYIVELKEAPVLAPAYTSGGAGSDDKPKAYITVAISTKSFAVLGSTDEVPAQELLIENGKYPYAELAQVLRKYKTEYKVSENLVLTADSTIPYSVVVATMDATRKDSQGPLFPGVTLGLAVN